MSHLGMILYMERASHVYLKTEKNILAMAVTMPNNTMEITMTKGQTPNVKVLKKYF